MKRGFQIERRQIDEETFGVARRGKRKAGHREPNGRLQRPPKAEREEEVMSVALAQRGRVVGQGNARAHEAGYPLGRLLLQGYITRVQHDAGVETGRRMRMYGRVIGVDVTGPRSPFPLISGGGLEWSEERVAAVKRDYREVVDAIQELRFSGFHTGPIWSAIRAVCGREEEIHSEDAIGDLRIGLNAVVRTLGLTSKSDQVIRAMSVIAP